MITIKTDILKEIAKHMKELCADIPFSFEGDKLHIRQVDASHIIIIDLVYDIGSDEYDGKVVGMTHERLSQILSQIKKIDEIGFGIDDNGRIELQMGRTAMRFRSLVPEARRNVLDLQPKSMIDLSNEADLNDFRNYIALASKQSYMIEFEVADGRLKVTSAEEMKDTDLSLDMEIDTEGEAICTYPTDHLYNILKAIPDKGIIIHFDTDYPMLVEFERGYYLLAPSIRDD